METRNPTLKKILFIDNNHFDPLLNSLLTLITPELKNLGYDHFYEELPLHYSTQLLIEEADQSLQQGITTLAYSQKVQDEAIRIIKESGFPALKEKLRTKMKDSDNATLNEVVDAFISFYEQTKKAYAPFLANHQSPWIKALGQEAVVNQLLQFTLSLKMIYHELPLSRKNFYQSLHDNKITFSPVDEEGQLAADRIMEALSRKTEQANSSLLHDVIDNRDKKMADFYMKIPEPGFGRIGFAHGPGLQKILREQSSLEKAKMNFLFIYPYSGAPIVPMQIAAQKGELDLPLGVINIDANNLDLDTLAKKVIEVIKEKLELSSQHTNKASMDLASSPKADTQESALRFTP